MIVGPGIPLILRDLRDLAERHDCFLVDQFGVLHDGVAAYPGAIEALSALKAAGKAIVLLSNSGKRSDANEKRLLDLGFARGSWDVFLSSGELAWRMFAGGGPGTPKLGAKCLLLSRDNDRTAVQGLDIELVDRADEADIVLLAGSEGDIVTLDWYRQLLAPAAANGVACICTNPDKIMLTQSGPRFGAGLIADLYEELGGPVTRIGKPYRDIYRAALAEIGNPSLSRVVGIGDSIEHDIAGAKGADLAAALVRSGILADMPPGDLDDLFRLHDARPDYVLPRFVWRPEQERSRCLSRFR